mmetsp:Transcript_85438/g.275008  ORF Transcript_85438/g.275008 Transcript_85438/m.275008 type:complete len:142 (-) Transcript_85438:74-499(-)
MVKTGSRAQVRVCCALSTRKASRAASAASSSALQEGTAAPAAAASASPLSGRRHRRPKASPLDAGLLEAAGHPGMMSTESPTSTASTALPGDPYRDDGSRGSSGWLLSGFETRFFDEGYEPSSEIDESAAKVFELLAEPWP